MVESHCKFLHYRLVTYTKQPPYKLDKFKLGMFEKYIQTNGSLSINIDITGALFTLWIQYDKLNVNRAPVVSMLIEVLPLYKTERYRGSRGHSIWPLPYTKFSNRKALALLFLILPIGCCCIIIFFSAIVFREFLPLLVPRIVAKFIPEKVKNLYQTFFKWLFEKLSLMFLTTGIPPKECSSPNCIESRKSLTETTSFINKSEVPPGRKSVQTYQTPAFLQTSTTKESIACET